MADDLMLFEHGENVAEEFIFGGVVGPDLKELEKKKGRKKD